MSAMPIAVGSWPVNETVVMPFAFAASIAPDDIYRPTRCGNADEHVAGISERFGLPRKDRFVSIVIADCGESGSVNGERKAGSGGAVIILTTDQFGGQVLGVCCRPTIDESRDVCTHRSGYATAPSETKCVGCTAPMRSSSSACINAGRRTGSGRNKTPRCN
jgi:hypothetical protein